MEQNLVVKANKLNESRYKLSVQEQRIVLTMLSMLKPGDLDFKPYSFAVKDFAALVGIEGKNIYGRIKELTKSLVGRRLTINEPDGDLQIAWLSSAKYFDGSGLVELRFDPLLKPYLLALKQEFTRYQLKNTIRLKSAYSVRIYELLKQYQAIGSRSFEIEELRAILGVSEGKLDTYSNFKLRVIEPALAELKNTDISFTYEPEKTGRKVTGLLFKIFKNGDIVKKSHKKKAKTITETQPDLDFDRSNKMDQIVQIEQKRVLLSLQKSFPERYSELEKQANKSFTKKDQNKRGYKLSLKLKMESLVLKFIHKKKIRL